MNDTRGGASSRSGVFVSDPLTHRADILNYTKAIRQSPLGTPHFHTQALIMATESPHDDREKTSLQKSVLERRAPWLLVFAGFAVYAFNLQGPFVFDDLMWAENPRCLQAFWSLGRLLQAPPDSPIYGRPVAAFTLAINYAIGGLKPFGYHLFNIGVHVAATVVLEKIIRRSLQAKPLAKSFSSQASPIALACAVLWLVHPLQTECVNYISQRTELIAGLCILLTLYGAIRAREQRRQTRWTMVAIGSCMLGVAAKETVVVAPLLVVLYDLAFPFTNDASTRAVRRLGRGKLYAGLFASWLLLLMLLKSFPRSGSVAFELSERVLRYAQYQSVYLVHYLRLSFWPDPLVLDYGPLSDEPVAMVVPFAAAVIVLLLLTVVAWRFSRPLGFAWASFLLLLGPTSSFIPIVTEVAAERRMYLPLACIIVIVLPGVIFWIGIATERSRWLPANRLKAAGIVACGAIAIMLATATARRNLQYRSATSIWKTAVEARPDNYRAVYNLGVEQAKAGENKDAIATYQQVLALKPNHARTHNNLAVALQQELQFSKAKRHFGLAINNRKGWTTPVRNLAWLLATCERDEVRDGREAVRLAEWLVQQESDNPAVLDTLAAAYAANAEFAKSVSTAKRAQAAALRQGNEKLAAEIKDRQTLYEQNRAHREKRI